MCSIVIGGVAGLVQECSTNRLNVLWPLEQRAAAMGGAERRRDRQRRGCTAGCRCAISYPDELPGPVAPLAPRPNACWQDLADFWRWFQGGMGAVGNPARMHACRAHLIVADGHQAPLPSQPGHPEGPPTGSVCNLAPTWITNSAPAAACSEGDPVQQDRAPFTQRVCLLKRHAARPRPRRQLVKHQARCSSRLKKERKRRGVAPHCR